MKILFIGGTGNISMACTRLALSMGMEVHLLNRGNTKVPKGANNIICDIENTEQVTKEIAGYTFDVVVNFIAFTPLEILRDIELFKHKTQQYIFISSASAYQKPLSHPVVTESTPLKNPFWQYSRDKIACEDTLMEAYRTHDFPITIVRPSLTYESVIPVPIGGWKEYNVVDRIKNGKPVIVHGDGSSLWTITHAEDFAKGFIGLLGNQQAIGHSFHITSDEILTWDQIYDAVGLAIGKPVNKIHISSEFISRNYPDMTGSLIGDKATSCIFDNSKIKSFVPGFQATIPFKTGIKSTIDWFESDKSRQVLNPETDTMIEHLIKLQK